MSSDRVETPPVLGLWHLALNVRDLSVMRRFYVDLLGYEVEWAPDEDNVFLTRGRDNLALHRRPGFGAAPPGGRLDHLGLVVPAPEDVDAWAEHLALRGVPLEGPVRTHRDGARSLYVRDPEGNLLQILYHPPLAPSG